MNLLDGVSACDVLNKTAAQLAAFLNETLHNKLIVSIRNRYNSKKQLLKNDTSRIPDVEDTCKVETTASATKTPVNSINTVDMHDALERAGRLGLEIQTANDEEDDEESERNFASDSTSLSSHVSSSTRKECDLKGNISSGSSTNSQTDQDGALITSEDILIVTQDDDLQFIMLDIADSDARTTPKSSSEQTSLELSIDDVGNNQINGSYRFSSPTYFLSFSDGQYSNFSDDVTSSSDSTLKVSEQQQIGYVDDIDDYILFEEEQDPCEEALKSIGDINVPFKANQV